MNKDIERILFGEEEIAAAVNKVAERIKSDYKGKNPLFIGILKGSVVFMSDLIRAAKLDCEIDFMVAKSYWDGAISSGEVKIMKDTDAVIAGKDIILVEDILDSGRTLYHIREHLLKKNPASVKICAFLNKKTERAHEITEDYKCFDIENEFVVGYGLDYAEKYRALPYVGVLKKEIYTK